ncbi:Na+/H+ antiporter subunit E [Desulfobulbus alkaliphilus]|uniref:Na+/H+ antiporter subunit E n=1 Tax=Desulfobulbus alkaliphilus TaxID=869814 RepID=UPI0019663A42|nr:Na+/H+ antiporter subunit E [Desulfobulbus alkaliphilus]MBM9537016.1 Na+/H+ antiporter subunit E [Desulfobulbus alkaliphilus]
MSVIITFCVMFALWIVMSGKFDLFHLGMGVLSTGLVTWLSHDLLFSGRPRKLGKLLAEIGRFLRYMLWLFWQIVLANIHIASLALSPRSNETLDPRIIKFKTVLKTDFAQFVFANSITLTPGTTTIRIQDGFFYVHAITVQSAGDLAGGEGPGEMERWVAWVFEGGKR